MTRPRATARRYSNRTIKILWGRAAGRCAMPECRIELFLDDSAHDPIVIIGDIAHVEASSDHGPRGNLTRASWRRDKYENLILLCKNCHARIDGQTKKFSEEAIHRIKSDHEAWVRASLPERGLSRTGWTVLLLQGGHPIDAQQTVSTLRPDYPENSPHIVQVCPGREDWQQVRNRIASSVQVMFERNDPFNQRFAIFPLAPVSACVTLGFCLTDRPRVKLFQYHRHSQSWDWGVSRQTGYDAKIMGLPGRANRRRGELILRFELSAAIQKAQLRGVGRNVIGTVRLRVPQPSTSWLRAADQLDSLGEKAHELFQDILRKYPNATRWHLLVATPAPAAVKIGQAMNPSMIPPVQLYEFNRGTTPAYVPSIRLGGEG